MIEEGAAEEERGELLDGEAVMEQWRQRDAADPGLRRPPQAPGAPWATFWRRFAAQGSRRGGTREVEEVAVRGHTCLCAHRHVA